MHGQVAPAAAPSLVIAEVDRRFAAIAELRGTGSGNAKKHAFGKLLAAATAAEQGFLAALVVGGLRQGALDAVVVDAIALATRLEPRAVRSAYMLAGDIGAVAAAALTDGAAGLARFGLTVFRPVLPMLAQTADSAAEALASFAGPAALELKLDGFRVQIHKDGDLVRVYSRSLNDVTAQVPAIVAAAAALPAGRLILDGEAIALGPNGRPLPFQDTMRRLGRKPGPARTAGALDPRHDSAPLTLTLFDILMLDDQTLLAATARERFAALADLSP